MITTPKRPAYVGRFAPSPTGELHQGSLLTAVASYLDARKHKGQWLVRMEDLDPPREQQGAAKSILNTLEQHGLHWDGDVVLQSQRHHTYQEALQQLTKEGLTYKCDCNRQRIKSLNNVYDGHCLNRNDQQAPSATRLKVEDRTIRFEDLFQGMQSQNLTRDLGDFVIHRKDGLFAYQLAVVVDDIDQNISHVIRGNDLLSSTPRQLWIFEKLHRPSPSYGHIPVIVNSEGQKLSKQTFAQPLDNAQANQNLHKALTTLGLIPPFAPSDVSKEEILQWAIEHWQRSLIPKQASFPEQN